MMFEMLRKFQTFHRQGAKNAKDFWKSAKDNRLAAMLNLGDMASWRLVA
jgi:hypothetical protein